MPRIDDAWVGGGTGTLNSGTLCVRERGQRTSVRVTYDQGG